MDESRILIVDPDRRYVSDRATSEVGSSTISEPTMNNSVQEERMPNIYEVKRYRTVKHVWATILSLAIEAILVAVVIQLRWYCRGNRCVIRTSSIAVYLNSAVWLYTLIVHRYISHQRNQLRRYGYAEFYRKTKTTSTAPFLVFSFGGIILLIYLTVLYDLGCFDTCNVGIDAFGWIQIIIVIEVLIAFPLRFVYLVDSLQFNRCRHTPDIFRESCLDQDNVAIRRDVGFRGQTLLEELLEKQADAISYLKLRCEDLTRTIYNLSSLPVSRSAADDLRASFGTNDTQFLCP